MVKGNVLVIGNSGVGKSTLINAVLGEDSEKKAVTGKGIRGTTLDLEIYENEVDEYLNNLKDKYDINYESDLDEDDEEEYYIDICKDILNHLDLCLEENVFLLPKDADLRFDIYDKFFAINSVTSYGILI